MEEGREKKCIRIPSLFPPTGYLCEGGSRSFTTRVLIFFLRDFKNSILLKTRYFFHFMSYNSPKSKVCIEGMYPEHSRQAPSLAHACTVSSNPGQACSSLPDVVKNLEEAGRIESEGGE